MNHDLTILVSTDVLVDRDNFGEEGSRCAGGSNGRSKSLCCEKDCVFLLNSDTK